MDSSGSCPLHLTAVPAAGPRGPALGHAGAMPLPLHSGIEFAMEVDRALADCRRRRTPLAVLVFSITEIGLTDHTGAIGHAASPGQEHAALEKLSQRMQRLVRSTDKVVRLDSHHIGVILSNSGESEACIVDGRANRSLCGPYSIDAQLLAARLEIGRANFPADGVIGKDLVRVASHGLLKLA